MFLKRAFLFDFVMILAGMYTKCLEMFCFVKDFVMIHAGIYTKCFEFFLKSVRCKKYFDRFEQAKESYYLLRMVVSMLFCFPLG